MNEEIKTAPAVFDIDQIDTEDTANMVVLNAKGEPTTWVWTFAGPGHIKAIELSKKLTRERLALEKEQQQAQVNGKKWKAELETPESVTKRNAEYIVARLLGWNEVLMGGQPYAFTPEKALTLLMDPRKGSLAMQALEFLTDQKSFTKRSVTNS